MWEFGHVCLLNGLQLKSIHFLKLGNSANETSFVTHLQLSIYFNSKTRIWIVAVKEFLVAMDFDVRWQFCHAINHRRWDTTVFTPVLLTNFYYMTSFVRHIFNGKFTWLSKSSFSLFLTYINSHSKYSLSDCKMCLTACTLHALPRSCCLLLIDMFPASV